MKSKQTGKILFFDFDGVLVDSFEMNLKVNKFFYPKMKKALYRKLFLGNVFEEIEKGPWLEKIVTNMDWDTLYEPEIYKLPMVSGAKEMLHRLSKKFSLFIVSSTKSSIISNFLKQYNCGKYFERILGYDFHKNKTEKINYVLSKHGSEPKNSMFITDTVGDILEARKAGVESIAVTDGFHTKTTLKKGRPWKIVNGTEELEASVNEYFVQTLKNK